MNKTITIKELLCCAVYLISGLLLSIYYEVHSIMSERVLFTGAIYGTLLFLICALFIATFRSNKKDTLLNKITVIPNSVD